MVWLWSGPATFFHHVLDVFIGALIGFTLAAGLGETSRLPPGRVARNRGKV